MDKQRKKILKRKFAWVALRIFTVINGFLPLGWAYFLGNIFGRAAYFFTFRHRKIALESLSIAFPGMDMRQRTRIARRCSVFMVQSSLELLHYLHNANEAENVRVEGREYLNRALSKNQGVIIVTGHLGNFPLMSLKLAREGLPVNIVVRPMRDTKADDYVNNLRKKAGVKTIYSYPRRECVGQILKALRDNEIIVIQMDQNFGTGGVWVKFFGRLAATPVGPIIFSQRTNAVLLPAFIYRQVNNKHCIKIYPQHELIIADNKEETILLNTIKLTRLIEAWVRQFPEQWGWIHRRWKSRPSPKVRKLKFKVEEVAEVSL